jgi:hypothetical protein
VRVTVNGSWRAGEHTFTVGDIHIDTPGNPAGEPVAAGRGAKDVVIFGDRRPVFESLEADTGWSDAARAALRQVQTELREVVAA